MRSLEPAVAEHAALVAWCAAHGVPVERNDQNQWGLRHASEMVQVAAAALTGGLAAAGVATLRAADDAQQPRGHLPGHGRGENGGHGFAGPRPRRGRGGRAEGGAGGLFSLPVDPDRARGQLASATRTAMLLRSDVLHVVGLHRSPPHRSGHELVASCTLVHQVIDDALLGLPDSLADPGGRSARPPHRRGLLPARRHRDRFPGAGGDPTALAAVVRTGHLDAPYLPGSPAARGAAITVVDGGCDAVDPVSGRVRAERERLAGLE